MYDKILVAIDHSAASDRALAAAKDLAALSKGEVWVLHLQEREVIARMGDVPVESGSEAGATVEDAVKLLVDAGLRAHGEVRETLFGHAAREIVADAKLHDVGVIVMGSRGRSELAGLVLGSTAHKVIHLTERPVLVVR
ncbi:MAG TPA: universal stress protein [Streptosporangiaceae bacterium]|nr:universal stress protein [Streptosporangiaceae bacterium]